MQKLRAIPTVPAISVDIAVIVPAGVSYAQIEGVISREGGELLSGVACFDEYRGPGIPAGARGLSIRLSFQSRFATLTLEEVKPTVTGVLHALDSAFGVTQR